MTAACLALLLAGCGATPGGVHVTVESTLVPGTDFDSLSVTAFLAEGRVPLSTQTFTGEALTLPRTVNFVSGQATAAGTEVIIEVTAELGGEIVSFASAQAVLAPKRGAEVTLTLPARAPPTDGGAVAELCDNGVDDNGDGRADCADEQCEGQRCQAGGFRCAANLCACATGTAGLASERGGFALRNRPMAVRITAGPFVNHVAVAGGTGPSGTQTTLVELISLTSTSFATASMTSERGGFSLLALPDGGLLLAGGDVSTVEFFPARDGGFEAAQVTPALTAVGTTVLYAPDALLLAGGELQGATPSADVVKVQLVATAEAAVGAQRVVGQMSQARSGSGAVLLSGELLMVGGVGAVTSDRTDLIAPNGSIRAGPTLPAKLSDAAAIRLRDGRVLIIGGQEKSGQSTVASARAFIATATGAAVDVRELASMTTAKATPGAALMDNGWVYVSDGAGNADWFDPASETFIAATALTRAGYTVVSGGTAAVALVGGGVGGLPDGKVVTLSLQCQ